MMKSVTQWLEDLPEPYRSQALKNLDYEKRNDQVKSLEQALANGFLFYRAPEGYYYWHNYHAALVGNAPLPIPTGKHKPQPDEYRENRIKEQNRLKKDSLK